MDINVENAFSRGIPAGEYVVNVHNYRGDGSPIECTVQVRVKESAEAPPRELITTKLTLHQTGQEKTAFRFKLTEKGKLVDGSVHSRYKPLFYGGNRRR
jgi:hypothetical protein